ncbi:MAG TPA: ABC transporter permease, partial [Bryobacteraceae bacterium]|nr:ABC transporter permease [Bryobacteraceae bacterium]
VRGTPEIGRLLDDADDEEGRGNVAVISHAFWQSHFGSNPDAIGRKLTLSGKSYSIVGVAHENLNFPAWAPTQAEVWIPLAWDAKERAERKNHNYLAAARLKPGVSVQQAQAEMNTISKQLEDAYPEADRDWGAAVDPLRENLVAGVRPVLLVLMGAVAFVLLIACANVANLITARNLARSKEMAVRTALGASRGRALQQLLCESVLLSMIGGAAGLGLALLAMPLLVKFVNQQFSVGDAIPLDAGMVWFTLGISLVTGIVAGAFPAWRGSRIDVSEALKQSAGRSASEGGARRTRGVLVAVEVALSLMLLAGAGLMIRSLWLLTGVNPGFDAKNVQTMIMSIPANVKEPLAVEQFYQQALDRVRTVAGVESVGLIDSVPFRGGSVQPFTIEGRPAAPFAQQPTVRVRAISAGYLRTMRIPLMGGRDIADTDVATSPKVVLISEAMARKFWPGEDAVGKRLRLSFRPDEICQVAGVVGDVKQNGLDAKEAAPTLYTAESQTGNHGMTIVARSQTTAAALIAPITREMRQLAPDQPVRRVRSMQEIVDASVSNRSMSMWMLAAFAGLALALAGFGLYSVLAYTVRRRVREIGIRMALGASAGDVLKIVVWDGMKPTMAGIAIGLGGAFALSSLLGSLIYGIRASDPLTFGAVTLALIAVALAASVLPAWRATRVDPIQVLREE